jgi:hypothetical protein
MLDCSMIDCGSAGLYCTLTALYFCTGEVCITKQKFLSVVRTRQNKKARAGGFTLGQVNGALERAKTPYRVVSDDQLTDLVSILSQRTYIVMFGVMGEYRGNPVQHCAAYCPHRGEFDARSYSMLDLTYVCFVRSLLCAHY